MFKKSPLALALPLCLAAGLTQAETPEQTLVVSSSRLNSDLSLEARQVDVFEQEEIQMLSKGSHSIAEILGKLIPGMAPASQTMTNFGLTLRGRTLLVLVDGIPMQTNRNVSRDMANLTPATIQRIEVIRGGNAIYGTGATGGVINITTLQPSADTERYTEAGFGTSLKEVDSDGLSTHIFQSLTGSTEAFDYALWGGFKKQGAFYDANGDRIAPEASQGDLMDSDNIDLGLKLGHDIDDLRRIQLSVMYKEAIQDTDYGSDPSVASLPLGSASAQAVKGLKLDDQNELENTLVNLQYSDLSWGDNRIDAQLYYRDYYTRFMPFSWNNLATDTGTVNREVQTYLESEVWGGRFTVNSPLDAGMDVVWGLDFNHDTSENIATVYDSADDLVYEKIEDRVFRPEVTTFNKAAFAQLRYQFNPSWLAEAGVRYEHIDIDWEDFTRFRDSELSNPGTTAGGDMTSSDTLFNASLVYQGFANQEVYAAFNQGFEQPDTGHLLRDQQPGFVPASSTLEPVTTDNYELGWRGNWDAFSAEAAVFYSDSDYGKATTDGLFASATRQPERIWGAELGASYRPSDLWGVGANITWIKGELEINDSYEDMDGYRIPPLKIGAFLDVNPTQSWRNKLVLQFVDGEDYRLDGQDSFARHKTDSYWTVDLMSQVDVGPGTLSVGIENLFNKEYYPLYSQLYRSNSNTSHVPGRGINAQVSYGVNW